MLDHDILWRSESPERNSSENMNLVGLAITKSGVSPVYRLMLQGLVIIHQGPHSGLRQS